MLVQEMAAKDDQNRSWVCGACNTVWFDEELAEGCCRPGKCSKCSASTVPGGSLCVSCVDRDRVVHEEGLFRAARKIPYSDYERRYIYWTPPGLADGVFFSSRTELEKYCEARKCKPPRWCWAAEEARFLLDAEHILAGVVTRTNEEVRPLLSEEQVEHFQKILDDWAMGLDIKSWDVDFDTAVLLDRELYEAVREKKKAAPEEEESD